MTGLSYHWRIGYNLVQRITVTWIQFMFKSFDSMRDAMYVTRDMHKPLPLSFRNPILRDVRIVLDCTEIYFQSSGDFAQQGNMYSQYKGHSTTKVLIGVSPSGACMFVSDCFEGNISDKKISVDSGVLDKIMEGDVILADKGFTFHDLCAEKGATLEIPRFLEGRPGFEEEEDARNKLIARSRVHVERFNARIKKFRILSGIVPLNLAPLISQIVFVTCCLINFKEPLLRK